jgi:hypothetical protein
MACDNRSAMRLLRMKPGHGEIVLAEGDVQIAEQEQKLIEAFRRELDAGMWAAVPIETTDGRREAELVKSFADVPRDAERVIFFPRAAGGALPERTGTIGSNPAGSDTTGDAPAARALSAAGGTPGTAL